MISSAILSRLASPIEKAMAAAMAARTGIRGLEFVPTFSLHFEECRLFANKELPGASAGALVFPHVRLGPFEIDFLMLFKNTQGALHGIAVECDGHDFHEKTKQQAAHDKRRDRYIALHSIPMLRFTGAEIHRDVDECAAEAHRVMLFVQAGPREHEWPIDEAAERRALEADLEAELEEHRAAELEEEQADERRRECEAEEREQEKAA